MKRDRIVVIAGLAAITLLSWAYIIHLNKEMAGMDMGSEMSMPRMRTWRGADLRLTFLMWTVMMAAMMTPTVSLMILTYAAMSRRRDTRRSPTLQTTAFLLGYLLVWLVFSVAATLIQWELHSAALLSPMMVSTSQLLSGLLLVAAGAYQLTPLKQACLSRCRHPLGFLMSEWRDGATGTLVMGLRHGLYCLGCCWLLMALLFVAGVMNLLWVALLTFCVLLEKTVPAGRWISRVVGLAAAVGGVWILAHAAGG